jgi:hypothetical protein
MGKRSQKSIKRQAQKMMKQMGIPTIVKEAVGGLNFSSKGKKSNKHTNSKIGKKKAELRKQNTPI